MAEQPSRKPDARRQLGRVDSFSDGLFAVAATVLALSIEVPHVPEGQLTTALDDLIPGVTAYFIAFAVIGLFWLQHHDFFGRLEVSDTRLARINLLFLSIIALLPVPTDLLGRYDNSAAPVVIFAVFILVLVALMTVLERHAARAGLFIAGRESSVDRVDRLSLFGAFGISIPVAYVHPDWGMYCWILSALVPVVAARVRRSRSG